MSMYGVLSEKVCYCADETFVRKNVLFSLRILTDASAPTCEFFTEQVSQQSGERS